MQTMLVLRTTSHGTPTNFVISVALSLSLHFNSSLIFGISTLYNYNVNNNIIMASFVRPEELDILAEIPKSTECSSLFSILHNNLHEYGRFCQQRTADFEHVDASNATSTACTSNENNGINLQPTWKTIARWHGVLKHVRSLSLMLWFSVLVSFS